jgi:hypothetical protein
MPEAQAQGLRHGPLRARAPEAGRGSARTAARNYAKVRSALMQLLESPATSAETEALKCEHCQDGRAKQRCKQGCGCGRGFCASVSMDARSTCARAVARAAASAGAGSWPEGGVQGLRHGLLRARAPEEQVQGPALNGRQGQCLRKPSRGGTAGGGDVVGVGASCQHEYP